LITVLSHSQKEGYEFIFKIGESTWSKVNSTRPLLREPPDDCFIYLKMISFEAPAAETELVVTSQRQKADHICTGLSWSEGLGKYKLSKVITLAPRFLIKNQLPETIAFREHGVAPKDRCLVESGDRCAFQVLRSGDEKLLTVAYPGLNTQW
jgi:vacuolar protein sorting-associated protein 13A/C